MIELYNKTDFSKIMDIWLQTNISAHNFIPQSYWADNFELVKNLLPTADIYVYTQNEIPCGFIGISDKSYIAGLFVLEDFQGQGIGKKLLSHCQKIYSHLTLHVYKTNEKAVLFYKKNGFEVLDERNNAETGCMEFTMQWKI